MRRFFTRHKWPKTSIHITALSLLLEFAEETPAKRGALLSWFMKTYTMPKTRPIIFRDSMSAVDTWLCYITRFVCLPFRLIANLSRFAEPVDFNPDFSHRLSGLVPAVHDFGRYKGLHGRQYSCFLRVEMRTTPHITSQRNSKRKLRTRRNVSSWSNSKLSGEWKVDLKYKQK